MGFRHSLGVGGVLPGLVKTAYGKRRQKQQGTMSYGLAVGRSGDLSATGT